jgi:hypothetical protein
VANSSFQDDPADALSKVQHEANERVDIILRGSPDDAILPAEFIPCVSNKSTGSRRKQEDLVFIKLYRGYSSDDTNDWVWLCPVLLLPVLTDYQPPYILARGSSSIRNGP